MWECEPVRVWLPSCSALRAAQQHVHGAVNAERCFGLPRGSVLCTGFSARPLLGGWLADVSFCVHDHRNWEISFVVDGVVFQAATYRPVLFERYLGRLPKSLRFKLPDEDFLYDFFEQERPDFNPHIGFRIDSPNRQLNSMGIPARLLANPEA